MTSLSTRTSLRLAAVAAPWSLGCADGSAGAPTESEAPLPVPTRGPRPEPETDEGVGSLSLALRTEHGSFDSFRYAITGPSFSRSGRIDVARSGRVPAVIEGLPVGSGYAVTLSGSSVDADVACSGSANFAIRAGEVTQAPVAIACHFGDAPEEPPEQPPAPPAAAPLPPLASAALAVTLLGLGTFSRRLSSLASRCRSKR